ncbi:very short patch repair endonuclease [Bradyrhizobium sp. F1.4.3]|uniref:very short patch repair endonuclease n=1 Tax=Bradyrhizobium sp. F1.4.3 TaxID=3156356 RepID=UPI0033975C5C
MDVLTPRQRSHCMSRIRGKDTKPEMVLRRALWSADLRYRLHVRIPGRPDIVFIRARVAVFCDGCFWHGCPKHSVKPKTNSSFWSTKLAKNKARDEKVDAVLRAGGWTVMRFWEHEIEDDAARVARRVALAVRRSGRRKRGT